MAASTTGYASDEAIGQDLVQTYIRKDFRDSVQAVISSALKGNGLANYEFPLFSKTGERVEILLNATTRRDADGKIIGVVGVGQDVTKLSISENKQRGDRLLYHKIKNSMAEAYAAITLYAEDRTEANMESLTGAAEVLQNALHHTRRSMQLAASSGLALIMADLNWPQAMHTRPVTRSNLLFCLRPVNLRG